MNKLGNQLMVAFTHFTFMTLTFDSVTLETFQQWPLGDKYL